MSASNPGVSIDSNAGKGGDLGLTPFPPLTGFPPSTTNDTHEIEVYDSSLYLSDLQEFSRTQSVSFASVFETDWATILQAYTGVEEEAFLSTPPACPSGHSTHEPCPHICRIDAGKLRRAPIRCILHC